MKRAYIISEVYAERQKQNAIWGKHAPEDWAQIIDYQLINIVDNPKERLIKIIAVAFAALEAMED